MSRLVWLIFFGYLVFNYNKKCVVQVYPQLIAEFGLTRNDVGFISSSQQLAISIFTFCGGFLTDYVASSILFPLGLVICGLTGLVFPLGSSVNYFSVVWFLNGLGHGLELPTAMRLTKQHSTLDTYSSSWAWVLTAVNISGVLNPFISPFLAAHFGWRVAVSISGVITICSGVVCYYVLNVAAVSGGGGQNARANKTKVDGHKSKASKLRGHESNRVEQLLYLLVAVVMFNRFSISFGRLALSDWTQIYLINEKQVSSHLASLSVSIYEFVSIFGKLASGRLNDWLVRRYHRPGQSTLGIRLPLAIVLHVSNVIALGLYIYTVDVHSSLAWLSVVSTLVGIFSAANVLTLSVLSSEIGPAHHEGFISSLCNVSAKSKSYAKSLSCSLN